ncbi:unnamed protein product, partial [Prorocentrum cordatum]
MQISLELESVCSTSPSRAGSAISSAGSSWELVGSECGHRPIFFAGQALSLPEGGGRILATARCGGPLLVFLWTLVTVVRDPPSLEEETLEGEDFTPERVMPVEVWSRRYYRRSATDGLEIFLVRRKTGNCWAALLPDLSMGTITITAKTTVFSDPVPGIRWQALPALTQVQKNSFMQQATDGLRAGTIPALELYRPGRQAQQAVAVNVVYAMASSARSSLRTLRWALRSPYRVLGLLALGFVLFEALKYLGVVDMIVETWSAFVSWMVACRDTVIESSETIQEWVSYGGEWVEWARKLMPLRRWAALLLALVLLMIWGAHEMQEAEETGHSSVASSSASSVVGDVGGASVVGPPLPPPSGAPPPVAAAPDPALVAQLDDLAESQRAMAAELNEIRIAERARELRRSAMVSSSADRGAEVAAANQLQIRSMLSRLDEFEARLQGGAVAAAPAGAAGASPATPVGTAEGPASPARGDAAVPMETPDKRAASEPAEAVSLAIKRMRFKAQMPQQVFLEQLEDFKEYPASEWATRMPEGYRERIAPDVLSEVYSTGKTAEAWARDYIRDRGLADCNTAREMIATFAAVDTMLMTDRQKGLLNQVSFERLVRKGYALVRAYRNVHCRDDWSRPKDAKSWKSKVDWEAARRLDPQLADESTIRVMSAEEEVKKAMGRDAQLIKARTDLDGGGASPPTSSSRRVLSRWREELDVAQRANRCLLGLRQLYRGTLGDELLHPGEIWGQGPLPSTMDGDLSRRVLEEVRRLPPPPSTPEQGAAILRLRPAATAAENQSRSTYTQRLAELRRRCAGGQVRLPDRGETFPAHWERVALPPPGSMPVSARSVSPRVAQMLDDFRREMLKEDGEECFRAAEVKNYVDPHFRRKKDMLMLAKRMALAGMLCRCESKVDEVGLFCVVKKAEVVDGEPLVSLRLVFDQRRSNLRWRAPPWCAMGGVSAMSFLDVSEEMTEEGARMVFGTGDLPDFYYTLDLGEAIAPYFVLPGVRASELLDVLPSDACLSGSGEHVGVRVALMGFSWACWMAQTTMEDLFNSGPSMGMPALAEEQRLAEGGPLPLISREVPAARYEYIDDFGIIGVDYPPIADAEPPTQVRDIWLGAKYLVNAAGFNVHKDDCSGQARMIGGDFVGTRLAPNQDKMWLAVAGVSEILKQRSEFPDAVAKIVGILSWGFLITRGALSVFSEVYHWCMEFRGGPRRRLPDEVLRELAVAAAVVPLVSVDLAMPWGPTVTMFDASLYGGAIISAQADIQAPKERLQGETVLPADTGQVIEELADIAEEDPFAPLRLGRTVRAKVLRFFHLCSGHTRSGDLEFWLARLAASRGYVVQCTNVDIGFGPEFDLSEEVNVRRLELLAELEVDGGHAGPSCATWSRVRFQPGGPPPVRLRSHPWGRPGLHGADLRKVEMGSAQLLSSLRVLRAIALRGGSVSLEHPADPGKPPFPSIFATPEVLEWEEVLGAYRVTFPQCMWGCPALKLTTISGTAKDLQRLIRPCIHKSHTASLCGKDETGRFRTRVAQAYSSDLCRVLAECHLDAMLDGRERREAEFTERAVELLIKETLERRRRNIRDIDVLPASFLEAGLSLLPYSVGKKTALNCYVPNVRRFLEFALDLDLPMMSREEIDNSILVYLDYLVEDEEVGPHRGDYVVHGMAFVWPELSTGLPRANRALRAWHKMHVAGEGGPQPLEVWAALDEAMRLAGSVEAADAAALAVDAYLRSAEVFALRVEDIIDADDDVVAIKLGVQERNERTKTGVRQGVLIDRPHIADMLRARKAAKKPGELVFGCSVEAYRRALRKASDDIGITAFPAHSARHSGPSRDAAEGYRTVWAIQRRGRWASEKSVLRYMKTR